MSERDYYEILGLTTGADGTTVNRTYWHLARKYQTLASSDPRAHSMLDELNEAYGVLGTPTLRDEYDATRALAHDSQVEDRDERTGAKARRSWRAPNRAQGAASDITRSHPVGLTLAYALGVTLTVAGAGAAVWSGNLVIEVLAGCGVIAIGAAAARHTFSGRLRARGASRTQLEGAERSQSAAPAQLRTIAEPLNASIVRRRGASADELRMSTASMVGRWRAKAGAPPVPASEPDLTLVDIFRSEQEIETQSEPLSAVLEVLRGSRHPIESR